MAETLDLRASALRAMGTVGLALGLLAWPARAQERTSLAVDLSPVGDRGFVISGADVRGDRVFRTSITAAYQREPLVLITPTQKRDRVVVEQAWAHAQLAYALWHRLLVAAEVPVALLESGEVAPQSARIAPPPGEGPRLGDPSLATRVRFLGSARETGATLAVAGKLWLPIGSSSGYAGGDGLRGRLYLIAGGRTSRFEGSFESGVILRDERAYAAILPVRMGSAVTAGAQATYLLDTRRTLAVGPEVIARSVFAGGASLLDPRSTGVELWLSTRYRPGGGPWSAGAGVAAGIGEAVGTPDYRVALSAAWAPERPPPPPDRDQDAIPDARDACPDLVGVRSSDPIMHGCPEVPKDRDGDSIPDGYDACPGDAGEATGDRRTHGCPRAPDTDGDGEDDRVDACPEEPGVRSPDRSKNGCPAPAPRVELTKDRIEISEQVHFETGTAVIRPESDGLLRAVAKLLAHHPEVELVEVRGHTDNTGAADHNRRLSRERAAAVVSGLARHGVAPGRLQARGFGADRPVVDNATEEGRALNRRVEFVVRRVSGQEVPEGQGGQAP